MPVKTGGFIVFVGFISAGVLVFHHGNTHWQDVTLKTGSKTFQEKKEKKKGSTKLSILFTWGSAMVGEN